jgi:hypothetical protein
MEDYNKVEQWYSTLGKRRGYEKASYVDKTKHRNRMNLEPALILALMKIRPRTEVLACQKQDQSSHQKLRTILIIDKIFNRIICYAKILLFLY